MKTNFYFKNLQKADEQNFQNYLEEKLNRISKLLEEKEEKIADLKANVEYFQKHNAFAVKLDLKIGTGNIIGEEQSHDLFKGIDLAIDRLIAQLRKIKELRKEK